MPFSATIPYTSVVCLKNSCDICRVKPFEVWHYILRDIPRGKYNPEYMLDKEVYAEPKDVVARVQ